MVLLTYTVFSLLDGLMQVLTQLSDSIGMEENAWREWGFEAVMMLAIECIEGFIYIFIPVVGVFATVDFRYKKKHN